MSHAALRQAAVRGTFWGLVEKAGIQVLSAVVGVVMTRLLLPEDYGLIAMLDIVFAVALIGTDLGLGQAYIQRQETTREEESAVFFINTAASIILYLLLFATARLIAGFYRSAELAAVVQVYGITLPLQAAGMLPQNKLVKELRLQLLTQIKLASVMACGILGIALAVLGWGHWALVYYIGSYYLFVSVLLWLFSGWRPVWRAGIRHALTFAPFARRVMPAQLLDAVYTNMFTMLINKFYQITIGGYYAKARLLQNVPVSSAQQLLLSVSFPVLSKVQQHPHEFMAMARKQARVLSYVMAYIAGLMVLTAPPFVALVLTEKWLPMVPYFRLLCMLGLLMPILGLHTVFLNAAGRSSAALRIELLKKGVAVAALAVTLGISVPAVITGQIVAAAAGLVLHAITAKRIFGYGLVQQAKDCLPQIALAALLCGCLLLLEHAGLPLVWLFTAEVVLFTLLYVAGTRVLGIRELQFLIKILNSGKLSGSAAAAEMQGG